MGNGGKMEIGSGKWEVKKIQNLSIVILTRSLKTYFPLPTSLLPSIKP
jgi:hypothetical protein